ncbi:putative nuclease HARBI1 [Anastrepha ludens]|uniref:putative nuclease HARBI1 n=1 Tax=Anastrepha ludens TaxID=28586 RepID=UPI0023AF8169|nr:putative nuclease HARBI1 [Anastrepha ludens]
MDPSLLFYLSSSESEENEKIIRRQLRERSNPLALSNRVFLKRFRLTKEAFKYVLQSLNLKQTDAKAVAPVIQLAATLSLLASGGYQHSISSDYLVGMSQSTFSKLTSHVLLEMENKLCPQHVQFDPGDSSRCKKWFADKYKIDGVIGCVDGTHIRLQKPSADDNMYLNRRGHHSINAMIICDHTYKILAINCQFGGAAHDSFVWKHSDQRRVLKERFERNRQENSYLLGDSEYPLEPWCITPYKNPLDGSSECMFNDVHSKARRVIERTIVILKRRWRILEYGKKGRYHFTKVARFANVCAALHNICIQFKINYNPRNYESDQMTEVEASESNKFTAIGQTIRDQIKHSLLEFT